MLPCGTSCEHRLTVESVGKTEIQRKPSFIAPKHSQELEHEGIIYTLFPNCLLKQISKKCNKHSHTPYNDILISNGSHI